MNYTINQLRIFLKVVETSSITRASEELFMTQPAVSIQLKNFQDQFDIPLTELVGRKLKITDFGREIATIVQRAVSELDEVKFKTREYEGLLTGRLKISAASTGKYLIPFFLSDFLAEHSGVDLRLDVTNKTRVVESLQNGEIDFALVSTLPALLDIEEEILLENRLYMVGSQEKYDKNKPLIYREKGSATRMEMESYFKAHRGTERRKMELTSNEAVKQAVIAGLGYSVLPLIGIKNQLVNKELHIIPMRGLPLKTEWRLIWLKGKKLSPVAKAYLQFIRSAKSTILEHHFQWYLDYQ